MAKVNGVKEKLHMPLYDAFAVPRDPGNAATNTFGGSMLDPRLIRFFVDVQNKTRLETNLQASGVLPSQNRFEARAMRVVTSYAQPSGPPPNALPTDVFLRTLIFNSVLTLLVGEKEMISVPTFYFPAGAGVDGQPNNGSPDPLATFRFAEPVLIEPHQNFRVEMLFPQGVPTAPSNLATQPGPLRVWTILDGYLTRDVQ